MACDRCRCTICIALRGGRCLGAITAWASVHVPDLHATLLVNGNVEEVEQITRDSGPASCPDSTMLHWSTGCQVRGRPGLSAVKSMRNVKMPEAVEAVAVGASSRR